jgi:hypothetical protein
MNHCQPISASGTAPVYGTAPPHFLLWHRAGERLTLHRVRELEGVKDAGDESGVNSTC